MIDTTSSAKKKEFVSPAKQAPKRSESEIVKPKKGVDKSSLLNSLTNGVGSIFQTIKTRP